jgi:hypothetical protein
VAGSTHTVAAGGGDHRQPAERGQSTRVGGYRCGWRCVTDANSEGVRRPVGDDLPAALVEYADRLLLSTGLNAADALRIASSRSDPPDELLGLATALRAGWMLDTRGPA